MEDINEVRHFVHFSDNQTKTEIREELYSAVENVVTISLGSEKIKVPCEISFTFVDDEEMREINREYRNVDKSTDVLSFPLIEKDCIEMLRSKSSDEIKSYFLREMNPDTHAVMTGDIIISAETAQKQANFLNQSFEREVLFLTVHSVLHLLGYDHEKSKEDEKIMFGKQTKIMEIINIKLTENNI